MHTYMYVLGYLARQSKEKEGHFEPKIGTVGEYVNAIIIIIVHALLYTLLPLIRSIINYLFYCIVVHYFAS